MNEIEGTLKSGGVYHPEGYAVVLAGVRGVHPIAGEADLVDVDIEGRMLRVPRRAVRPRFGHLPAMRPSTGDRVDCVAVSRETWDDFPESIDLRLQRSDETASERRYVQEDIHPLPERFRETEAGEYVVSREDMRTIRDTLRACSKSSASKQDRRRARWLAESIHGGCEAATRDLDRDVVMQVHEAQECIDRFRRRMGLPPVRSSGHGTTPLDDLLELRREARRCQEVIDRFRERMRGELDPQTVTVDGCVCAQCEYRRRLEVAR